jgi:Cof subfamily protein (haloacid dehalogenase superfamily)
VIRLICVDVDGTLVGSSNSVLPVVWAAADRARRAGIRLAICSGRPGFGVTGDYAARLDPDGWHVFQNGASVVHLPDRSSRSARLSPEIVRALIARARQTGRTLEIYADTEYVFEPASDLARQHAGLLGVPFQPRPFEALEAPAVRAQWVLPHAEAELVMREPHPGLEMSASTSPVMPGATFVNLTPAGVSKASAVRTVAEAYGLSLAEVMFVGDAHNDAGAMQVVGFPVAMGNADPDVRRLARLQVGHVDSGGLAEAFEAALAATAA